MQRRVWQTLAVSALLVTACSPALPPLPGRLPSLVGTMSAPTIAPPQVREIPSPNFNERDGAAITAIVLHHTATASTAEEVARFFQKPKAGVSAHYTVDRTGYIVRSVPDDKRSWHAGRSEFHGEPNVNSYSIGIEICNVGDGIEPYPPEQVESVIKLVAWLAKTHQVPMSRLTRHRDVAIPAGRKTDTSNNFDHGYVAEAVQKLLDGQAPPAYRASRAPAGYDPTRQTYKVRPGDTYDLIADRIYDAPIFAQIIAQLNPGKPLTPGTVLTLPTAHPRL